MPAFGEDAITADNLDSLLVYLSNPAAGGRGRPASGPPLPPPPGGVARFTAPLGSMFVAKNGLSAINPPWGQLTAYDLNKGTIVWQAPVGTVPALAAKGIKNTGNGQRLHRNGPAATAGGLIFIGTWADRTVRAYDKDSGKVLWEKALEANPEGLAAVYEVGGRQYVAFCASGIEPVENPAEQSMAFTPGKMEAQGYYVFALPKKK